MNYYKYLFQQIVVALFITISASGMGYTLFRYKMPAVPRALRQFSYGMMAPFQHYRTHNEELTAFGLRDGSWHIIDMHPYLPFITGERAMRSYFRTFRKHKKHVQKYGEFAEKLRLIEAGNGRSWESVKLVFQKWPMSTAGYFYLRHEPFIEETFIVQTP